QPVTLRDAQRAVDEWIGRFAEGYWPPLSNLARLIEEVGELARELNHRYGHKTKKPDEPEQDLALELADILFVLIERAEDRSPSRVRAGPREVPDEGRRPLDAEGVSPEAQQAVLVLRGEAR